MTLPPRAARAFDYLEHSFFGDRACSEAQIQLLDRLNTQSPHDPDLLARYLALGLLCPSEWQEPYCLQEYKGVASTLGAIKQPGYLSGDHSLTLGDLVALPDHLSQFGAVRGLGRAQEKGLVDEVIRLLRPGYPSPSGVITDVAEDACETDGRVDWQEVERDLDVSLDAPLSSIPRSYFSPGSWEPPLRGPYDPAGAYSFDNPHYLDLVLFNHHHFGAGAFESWTGFHATALALADRTCESMLTLDEDELEDLARGEPAYASLRWDKLAPSQRAKSACDLLALRVHQKLQQWRATAHRTLVDPVVSSMESDARTQQAQMLARRTLRALVALVFESAGLHFLQDGLAAGHIRVDRAAHDLGMARYLHDSDGREGIVAQSITAQGPTSFVLFGDSYLLGRHPKGGRPCHATASMPSPSEVTACHIKRQRHLVLTQTAASLVHWALGGPSRSELGCTQISGASELCRHLPTAPTGLASYSDVTLGSLPQPPPPFAFQSLATSLSFDPAGGGSQTGIRLVFLSALGQMANWMTSYHFGFLQTSRPYDKDYDGDETLTEFSYMFHWRWAARFLVNAGAYTYLGFQGLGHDVSLMWGLGPSVGMTLLPEGWTKIPLDISLTYRMPLTLLNSRYGLSSDAIQVEAHWIELAVGLAFM
ncbi:MAG: hypothetical protein VX834_01140 [Myxococcota bacterium]|nr:hypothetical protein [Myxococcota bacterium]